MMLGDMGAEVIRVERTVPADLGIACPPQYDLRNRNKKSIALDLKSVEGKAAFMRLIADADALIEGFRPGVMERLGAGPADCWKVKPSLVFARATGWGQDGPLSRSAGHDINYIAVTGALDMIGEAEGQPCPPLNLLGDYGGGAMYMAFGVVCALIEAQRSGKGQVVDAAMIDGVTSLIALFHGFRQAGLQRPRGENVLDGGAPYYRCYRTRDGGWMAVGAIEAKFYATLLRLLELDPSILPDQNERAGWPRLEAVFEEKFRSRDRADWQAIFEGADACVSPVLSLQEAAIYPHAAARSMFVGQGDLKHPAPAPRLSRTPGEVRAGPPVPGQDTEAILRTNGFSDEEISKLTAMKFASSDAIGKHDTSAGIRYWSHLADEVKVSPATN
jgi:alpha-methylacyl-CoA racemase